MTSGNSFNSSPSSTTAEKRVSLSLSDTTAHCHEESESDEPIFHSPMLSPVSATQLLGTLAHQTLSPLNNPRKTLSKGNSALLSGPGPRSSFEILTTACLRDSSLGLINSFEEDYEKADVLCETLDLTSKLNDEGLTNLEKDQRTLSSALRALDQMCILEQQKFNTFPSLNPDQVAPVAVDLTSRLFYILEQYRRFSNYYLKAQTRLYSHKLSILGNAYQTTKQGWQQCQRELAQLRIQQAMSPSPAPAPSPAPSPSPLNGAKSAGSLRARVQDLTVLVEELELELEKTLAENVNLKNKLKDESQAHAKTKAELEGLERASQEPSFSNRDATPTSSSSTTTFSNCDATPTFSNRDVTPTFSNCDVTPTFSNRDATPRSLKRLQGLPPPPPLLTTAPTATTTTATTLLPPTIVRRHEELIMLADSAPSTPASTVTNPVTVGGVEWSQVYRAKEEENKELRAQIENLSNELRRESNKSSRIMGKLETLQQLTDECLYGSNGFSEEQALRMVSGQLVFLLKDASANSANNKLSRPIPVIKSISTTSNNTTFRTMATPTRSTTIRLASPRIVPIKSPRGEAPTTI